MELLKVDSVQRAFEKLAAEVSSWNLNAQRLPLNQSLGKVLHDDIFVEHDIPGFCRSTVDGYAVWAKDTAAANDSIPVLLNLIGQVEMGQKAGLSIVPGQCAEVPTGGMLPEGANAVVMIEYAEAFGTDGIAIHQSVSVGENMVQQGEDALKHSLLLPRGKLIGPQEIGALAAAGIMEVPVFKPLKIAIISTGDELVSPDLTPSQGQIRDINTYALVALAEKTGFEVAHTAVLGDDARLIEEELLKAMKTCDIITISGGSSQGKKDTTREVIDRVSSPGVFTHGMAIKPGKPTILGIDAKSQTLYAGLPGHPVSAMIVFEVLLSHLWRFMTGTPEPMAIPAELTVNVVSSPGKMTCWPVKLTKKESGYLAEPVFGKSGLITTLTKADGYFTVDRHAEGLTSGSQVYVHLF